MARWSFPLKQVAQADQNGCGIACVAIVCGLTYERARAEAFPRQHTFRDEPALWIGNLEMAATVRRLGFRATERHTFRAQRCPAILTFAWNPDDPRSLAHAVVWDPLERRLVDPDPEVEGGRVGAATAIGYLGLWKRTGVPALLVTGRYF